MQKKNLPSIDFRYWVGMLIASLLGTTLGDFISNTLGLGFEKGLLPMAVLFAIILVIEKRAKVPNESYYWAAVVVTRAAATNLADLATHQFKIEYYWVSICLGPLIVIALLIGRWRNADQLLSSDYLLSKVGLRYWSVMALASTFGTNSGDLISDGLGLGFGRGSLLCGAVLVPTLFAQKLKRFRCEAGYWTTILIIRTSGTVMGDFLSGKSGLNFGFGGGAAFAALLLICLVTFWRND